MSQHPNVFQSIDSFCMVIISWHRSIRQHLNATILTLCISSFQFCSLECNFFLNYPRCVYFVLGQTGKYYCHMHVLSCSCCDGYCGPDNGCNCPPCQKLDAEEEERLKQETVKPTPSHILMESWTWGPETGNISMKTCSAVS